MGKSSIYTFPTTLDIVCKTKVFASSTLKPDTSSAEVPKSNFSPPILLHYIWEHSISFLGLVIVFWPTLLLLDPLKPRHVISSKVSLHEWFSIWREATLKSTEFFNGYCWWSVIIYKKGLFIEILSMRVPISAIALALFNSSAIVRVTSGLGIMISRFTKRNGLTTLVGELEIQTSKSYPRLDHCSPPETCSKG